MRRTQNSGIIEIYNLLYQLGLTADRVEFFYLSYAVWLAALNSDLLLMITKWLLPAVAKQYQANLSDVTYGIQDFIIQAWESSSLCLQQMAGCSFHEPPTTARFLGILSRYYMAHRAA